MNKNNTNLFLSNKNKNIKINKHSRNFKSFDNNDIKLLLKFSNKKKSIFNTKIDDLYNFKTNYKFINKIPDNFKLKQTSYQIYEENRNKSLSLIFLKSGRHYHSPYEYKKGKKSFNYLKKNIKNNKILNLKKEKINYIESQTQTINNFNKKNNNFLPNLIHNSNIYKLNIITNNLLKEYNKFKNK